MENFAEDLQTMQRVPLADEHVAAIREIAEERQYKTGDMVAEVGQPMDSFVYLLDGEIEVVDPYSGERLLDSSLGPTQFMGEIAFLNGGNHFLPMRAAKDTRTLEVERRAMLDLMARVPEMSDHIITVFAARRRRQFEAKRSAVKLIGADRDRNVREVERFLSRNRIPFQSIDLDQQETDEDVVQACNLAGHEPAVVIGKGGLVEDPTPQKVAQLMSLDLAVEVDQVYDLLIVGGGPAGVAAAVYAGSEGLSALVVEDTAIGGQAGTSSRIENFMGFPTGISGGDLVYRGQIQAMKFGSRFAMPRRVECLEIDDEGLFCATVEGGVTVCAKAMLVATGVQYRRLPLDRLQEFEGAGIFYAATEMEARFCKGTEAVVVGGGNSAGQAAMFLSRTAKHVHVLVRGDSLAASMSSYLRSRLEADDRITIHYGCAVCSLDGNDNLSKVAVDGPDGTFEIGSSALFVMIGAAPNTEWLSGLVELDDRGFVKTGAEVGMPTGYETSHPGIFAVGDVRSGSVKRVASAVGEGSVVVSRIWEYVNAPER